MWTSRARAVEVGSYGAEAAAAHVGWPKSGRGFCRQDLHQRGAKSQVAFHSEDGVAALTPERAIERDDLAIRESEPSPMYQPLADIRVTPEGRRPLGRGSAAVLGWKT